MAILVFVETADKKIKKSSLEAVSYAAAMGSDVVAVVLGQVEGGELEKIGTSGGTKVLHADDAKLNEGVIQAYASVLAEAVGKDGADTVVLAKSSLGDAVAARLSVKIGAGLVSNVVALPQGNKVKRSIYT
ncbi:MAG: electron transfer flavoprotein subunit alpha/FixB family protein, partial [Imperialibacter sp.]